MIKSLEHILKGPQLQNYSDVAFWIQNLLESQQIGLPPPGNVLPANGFSLSVTDSKKEPDSYEREITPAL